MLEIPSVLAQRAPIHDEVLAEFQQKVFRKPALLTFKHRKKTYQPFLKNKIQNV